MAKMSKEQTARYASPRAAENCTIKQALLLIKQLAVIGYKDVQTVILNDAVPLDTAIRSMEMDQDTPVYIHGHLEIRPDVEFDFVFLIERSKDAFSLYEGVQNLLNPGLQSKDMVYPFIRQMNLDDKLTDILRNAVKLPTE